MDELKAPGPGRDFDGCPKACGTIVVKVIVGAVVVTLLVRKVRG